MQMCWAGHPGTTEQPTCCINIAGLLLSRRFKKAAMLEGESFDFYSLYKKSLNTYWMHHMCIYIYVYIYHVWKLFYQRYIKTNISWIYLNILKSVITFILHIYIYIYFPNIIFLVSAFNMMLLCRLNVYTIKFSDQNSGCMCSYRSILLWMCILFSC